MTNVDSPHGRGKFWKPGKVSSAARGGATKAKPREADKAVSAWWRHPLTFGFLLVAMVALAYGPAFRAGFIVDDDKYVTENPMLTAGDGLRQIWFSAHKQSQYFPLVYTTFRMERELWGLNAGGYHAVNILLHGVNAVLVWLVLRRLRVAGAGFAAAVFALHPINVESVAWVAELKNVESFFFYLLGILAWLKFVDGSGRARWGWYALTLGAYLLALCAKTTACTLPAALLLILWLRGARGSWKWAAWLSPYVALGVAFGILAIWWEGHLGDYEESYGMSFGAAQRVLIAARALWFYVGKLMWPVDLEFSYPRWRIDPGNALQWAPLAAWIAAGFFLWRWRRKIGREAMAGILFFLAALLPMLGFVVQYTFHYSFVADRYPYVASIGLMAIAGAALSHWLRATGMRLPIEGAIVLVLGCLTWHQCGMYRNAETLWQETVAKNPQSWLAHHNLGVELMGRGQVDQALEQYRAAVALHPEGAPEQNDLGTALLEKRQYREAIERFNAALAMNPKLFQAQNNAALAYADLGDDDEAGLHFKAALELQPDASGTLVNYGLMREREGKVDAAMELFGKAAESHPSEKEPWRQLGLANLKKGEGAAAITAYKHGLEAAPGDGDLLLKLGYAYIATSNYDAAAECYGKTVQQDPGNATLHYNLGAVYLLEGKKEAARKELTEALRLRPDFAAARKALESNPE